MSRRLLFFGSILIVVNGLASLSDAQVPPMQGVTSSNPRDRAQQWMETKSYHVARRELESIHSRTSVSPENRDVLFMLMNSAFEDKDYQEAYQWASEFLVDYPKDAERGTALLIQGVSAFQIQQINDAINALTTFLSEANGHPQRAAGYFWRAMAEIERKDWASADDDIQQCYADPLAIDYKDNALMGWALALERRGSFSQADEYLKRLLAETPHSELISDARLRLASLSLRQGSPERCLQYLQEINPSTPAQREEYLLLRAEANFQRGRYQEALEDYGSLLDQYPESPYACIAELGLAWSKLQQGNWVEAQEAFDSISVRKRDSTAYAAMYQSGILALLHNNITAALSRFDTLINRSPYDEFAERVYFQMGMLQYRNKRYREARRNFQLAARLFPESPSRAMAYRMLGEAHVAVNDFANAQHAFAQVRRLSKSPELLAGTMFQEGICLYHLGRFKSSTEIFEKYLQQFPHDIHIPEAYVWRGEALYQDGRYAEGERSYADALRLFPGNPKRMDASYGLAWCLFEQKKFSQSAASFDRFIKEYPESDRVLEASLREADCYFFMGEYGKSSALYAALAEEKKSGRHAEYAAFQLGMSYIQRGESERGIEHLRKFLVRFPASIYNEVVQFNIGWTYFSKEQYSEALRELRVVVSLYPESQLMPRVLFNIGDAFYNLKQYDSARIYYQRVIREFPSSPLVTDAMTGLQYSYEAEGKTTAALAEIDTLLRAIPTGTSHEELLMRKGDILFGQEDFGGAVLEYQKLLSLKPSRAIHAKALHQIGRAYELENNPKQAITYYEGILKSFSDTDVAPAVALALGISYIKTKQYKNAMTTLQDFDRRYPQSPLLSEMRYNLGVAYVNLRDKKTALTQFQSVIQNHSDDIFADRSRLQIARMHIEDKKFSASLDTLNGLVNRRNDDLAAEALLMIGENYLSLKKPADALQAFKDVYEQYTEYPLLVERARLGAGECYERLRDLKQAEALYEEIASTAVDPAIKKDAEERLRRLRR
ncbi:MAG: tetratricopeptide repeat protein [Ignavibacteriae bacterium]|nr:tetratricopeptide repeat protein [Ignavibacteriota bacterium]